MIHKKVIDAIYKKFKSRPASPDELDIPLLFEKLPEQAEIEIDGDNLVIGSIDQGSLLHSIPVSHIHAIIDFDEAVAVVLPNSILFISKDDGAMSVHLKALGSSVLSRLGSLFSKS